MSRLLSKTLWKIKGTFTARSNMAMILGAVVFLPPKYWRPNFLFSGMEDKDLFIFTAGDFPAKLVPGKTHPLFTVQVFPAIESARVCPCSTKKPFYKGEHRHIKIGCRLNHTKKILDKTSYLIEKITFLLPGEAAKKLKFLGEVPKTCIQLQNQNDKSKQNYG